MEDSEVGANVRRVREGLGMSQADLAAAVRKAGWFGALPGTILKIEKAQRSLKFTESVALSEALGLPPGWLVEPSDAPGFEWGRLARLSKEYRQAAEELKRSHGRLGRARRDFDSRFNALDALLTELAADHPDMEWLSRELTEAREERRALLQALQREQVDGPDERA